MDKIFQKLIDNNFSDLDGLSLDASIPVPQPLVNEVINILLQGNRKIEDCQLSIHGQNRVVVRLKTSLWPWPLHLKLKLDSSVDLASHASPKLRAWLENNRLLGSLGSFLNALPKGTKLYGNQLVVDLDAFLTTPEQKQILGLITSIDLQTEEEKVILEVKVRKGG